MTDSFDVNAALEQALDRNDALLDVLDNVPKSPRERRAESRAAIEDLIEQRRQRRTDGLTWKTATGTPTVSLHTTR
jgi:hypothetical protein